MIKKQIYQLDLYKPSGEYAGKLDVYDLNVELNIDSFSTISFNIASFLEGKEENLRLYDVLDNYEVVLSYGGQKHRFLLRSLPANFDNNGIKYTYEGLSTESELDKKLIILWQGAKRTISHYYIPLKLEEGYEKDEDGVLKILKQLKVNFTVDENEISDIEDYIEIVEVRESKDIVKKTPLAQIDKDSEFFRRGSYDIEKDGNELTIRIAGYDKSDIYVDPNSDNKEYLFSEDLKIYYKIYLEMPFEATEDGKTGKYLISDAASKDGILSDEYESAGNYEETYFTTIGVTIEELLNDLLPKTWDYTIEENLNDDIEESVKNLKRSDLNTTNTTVYALLDEIKKSFDVVYFIDSDKRIIHFYKKYEDRKSTIINNIVLGEGAYLKSLDKTLDASSVVTNIYGYGKDYISTAMYSPSGASWFDYSYYLDEYWRIYNEDPYKKNIIEAFLKSDNKEDFHEKLDSLPTDSLPTDLSSRWMSKSLAAKIAIKQVLRDFIADVYLNKASSEFINDNSLGQYGILLKKSINIVERKQKMMEDYAKLESKYIEQEVKSDSYLKLVKNLEKKRKTNLMSGFWKTITEDEFSDSSSEKITLYNIPHDNAQWYLNALYNKEEMTETVAEVVNKFYDSKGYELYKVSKEKIHPTVLNVKVGEGSSSYDVMMATYQQHDIYRSINDGYELEKITIRTDEGYGYNYYNFKPFTPLYFEYTPNEKYFEKGQDQIDYERFLEKYISSSSNLGSMFADLLAFENKLFITDYQILTDLQLTGEGKDETSLFAYLLHLNKNNLESLYTLSEKEEKELEKFTFDYILQDNTVSNSEDLFEKVIELAKENSRPKVSLKVDIIDILAASETTDEEKENLNLGNYVYVLFPEFNIDEKAQIHSISINFDSNDISIDITTAETFSESLLHKMVSKIRDSTLYNKKTKFKEDENNKNKKSVNHIQNKMENNDVSTSDGKGTTFNGFGFESKPSEIDYDIEEFVPVEENGTDIFDISGGGAFLEREEEKTKEGIVSGNQIILNLEETFKINKFTKDLTSNSKTVSNLFWIDELGNIKMRDASLSITPPASLKEEGFNQDGIFIGYDDIFDNPEGEFPEEPERRAVLSLKQDNDFLTWNGRNLQMSGNVKARRGKIGGWNITGDRLYNDSSKYEVITTLFGGEYIYDEIYQDLNNWDIYFINGNGTEEIFVFQGKSQKEEIIKIEKNNKIQFKHNNNNILVIDRSSRKITYNTYNNKSIKIIYNKKTYAGMHSYNFGGNTIENKKLMRTVFVAGGKNWGDAKFATTFDGELKLYIDDNNSLLFDEEGLRLSANLTTKFLKSDKQSVIIGSHEKNNFIEYADDKLSIVINGMDLLSIISNLIAEQNFLEYIGSKRTKPSDPKYEKISDVSQADLNKTGKLYYIHQTTTNERERYSKSSKDEWNENLFRKDGWDGNPTLTLVRSMPGIQIEGGESYTIDLWEATGKRNLYKKYEVKNKLNN